MEITNPDDSVRLTPLLRADAVDDEFADDYLSTEQEIASYSGQVGRPGNSEELANEVPDYDSREPVDWEPYENGQGGWNYRPIY